MSRALEDAGHVWPWSGWLVSAGKDLRQHLAKGAEERVAKA
jgi:hypothetical protein